jgi:hypothetical protein
MKKIVLILLILCNTILTFGQMISVASDKLDFIYIGVDNPLTITVENTDCKDLIVKSTIGKIIGDTCKFIYRFNDATQSGKRIEILIFKNNKGKLTEIGKKQFRLKKIPNPTASVGGYSGGQINLILLKAQSFIKLGYEGFDFQSNIHVESFVLSIIRGDTCLYENIENIGSTFNHQVLNAIASLKKGDTIIFKKIKCKELGKTINDIEPIIFYLTE